MDNLDVLKKLALQVRNASVAGENTAERVGRILSGIIELLTQDDLEELKKIFLRKDEIDSTKYLLGLLGGAVVENGLVVRLPKQTIPAALMSCLLEEDIDTLIEEDEDAIVEVAPAEISDLSFGGLNNVNPSVDNAPIGSLPVKGENEWGYAAPTLFSGNIDEDNMLIPVFDRRIQQMVFIPISVIRGGVTPPATGFPYTFSFALG